MQTHVDEPTPARGNAWELVQGLLGTLILFRDGHEALEYIVQLLTVLIGG
jgi:hypothetical protein